MSSYLCDHGYPMGEGCSLCTLPTQQAPEPRDINKAIGNVIDHWEQLPNDLRSDPGFESLNKALIKLYNAQTAVPAAQQAEAGDALKETMAAWRQVLDRCLEEEMNMPAEDTQEDPGRILILRCLMPQLEVLLLDALTALKSSQQHEIQERDYTISRLEGCCENYSRQLASVQSSQQEEMARTSDNVIELAGKAVRACGGEKSKTILVARILDVELEAVHAAHLAEQAKAQEAHQNELEDVRDFKDVVIENNRKIYEQTSLASQAKLVRKCAATHCGGCKSGNVPSYGSRGLLWHLDANGIEDAICASRGTLELITPAMLQAEEAAVAAEKGLEE